MIKKTFLVLGLITGFTLSTGFSFLGRIYRYLIFKTGNIGRAMVAIIKANTPQIPATIPLDINNPGRITVRYTF